MPPAVETTTPWWLAEYISRQGAHNLYQRAHEALAAGLLDDDSDDSDDSDEDTNG